MNGTLNEIDNPMNKKKELTKADYIWELGQIRTSLTCIRDLLEDMVKITNVMDMGSHFKRLFEEVAYLIRKINKLLNSK